MIVWPLVRRPVSGSWRRRTTTQRLVWRRWFTAATCCWKRSRAPWRTLPSHSSAPATEHRASLRQPSPDRQHASWWISGQFSVISLSFQLAFFSTLKHQLKASKQKCAEFVSKGNLRCHTVSESLLLCCNNKRCQLEKSTKPSHTRCFVCVDVSAEEYYHRGFLWSDVWMVTLFFMFMYMLYIESVFVDIYEWNDWNWSLRNP